SAIASRMSGSSSTTSTDPPAVPAGFRADMSFLLVLLRTPYCPEQRCGSFAKGSIGASTQKVLTAGESRPSPSPGDAFARHVAITALDLWDFDTRLCKLA